jgi:hypothetical protein
MAGRPVKYNTPDQMQEVIDKYFNDCKLNRIGLAMEPPTYPENTITDDSNPTVSGLAYVLGMSRQALIDYEKKDEFLDTIKEAKARIESHLEQRLFMPSPTGVIFNLKNNYGWRDKSEVDLESPSGSMSPKSLDASQLSTEALQEILKAKDATNQ